MSNDARLAPVQIAGASRSCINPGQPFDAFALLFIRTTSAGPRPTPGM
jgi:hypothetical protein